MGDMLHSRSPTPQLSKMQQVAAMPLGLLKPAGGTAMNRKHSARFNQVTKGSKLRQVHNTSPGAVKWLMQLAAGHAKA